MPDVPGSTPNPVDTALFQGQKIEAIKRYRAVHQCDLKEAKDAVERRERELRLQEPSRFVDKPSGCLTVVLIVVLCGLAGWAAA